MTPKIFRFLWRSAAAFLLIALVLSPAQVSNARMQAGTITRVSVDSNEAQANAISYKGDISADGRFVAFDSEATNLIPIDTNNMGDVFLRDLLLGTTNLVSSTAAGAQVVDGGSGNPSISADGRFIAFESGASNLRAVADANGFTDIYVKDMQTGAVVRASLDSAGAEPNGESSEPSISGDGRYVVFASEANNLVANDTNGVRDIFVRDTQTNVTIGVSVAGNAGGFDASISLDGRFIVFNSGSTNFVPDDTNAVTDVFVYSVGTGQIVRASVNSSGVQGDHSSTEPSISGDGRYVTFSSASNNFTTLDTYGYTHLYIRDLQTGTTTLASYNNGYVLVGLSDASEISANGRYVIYSFDDKGDGMPDRVLYVYDRQTGTHTLVAGRTSDASGNALLPSISADGHLIAFAASANSFVADDTNNVRDIFVKEVTYPQDLNPSVLSVAYGCPNGCSIAADQFVDFLVKFSEPVTGVDMTDFALTIGGGIAGATVTTVSGAGSDYIIHVDTGTGDGTLRLDVLDDDSIKDFTLNPLGGAGAGNGFFTAGGVYIVDKSIVSVTSILRLDVDPTAGNSVRFAVNFTEPVTGVDATDFVLNPMGAITGAFVTDASGAGTAYIVTVNTGMGDGALRLDLNDDDSILDALSIPLGGLGIGNGNFFSGEIYTLHRTPPTVLSILRMDANPTAAEAVHFSVIFSEPVSGVDASDFVLTGNGVTGAFITELFVNANTYMITVNTGTGSGTLRLDLMDNDTIVGPTGIPLGGAGVGNGSFTIGDPYTISKVTYVLQTERLRSNGNNDGWVLESGEFSNAGGTKNSTALTFNIGDDGQDRQYRAILHFPTHHLPDNAVVTQAIVMIKVQGVVGTDPFTTHGNILIDVRYGPYGNLGPIGINALQLADFQAQPHLTTSGIIQNDAVGGWYWAALSSSAFPYINKIGVTQLRLAFQLDDNDDFGADYLTFFSGDALDQRDRPRLVVEYYLP